MSFKYELEFHPRALKEFLKLASPIRTQFKIKITKILDEPYVRSAMLHGILKDTYKIKLRGSGFRLVYCIDEKRKVVQILAVGKREKNGAYVMAEKRKP